MSSGAIIEAVWTGEVFQPVSPYMQRRADKEYARGEILRLSHNAERSGPHHRGYFASVKEAWENLPALMTERFPSPDHLRRWALIKAGYFNSHSLPCASPAEARRLAAFIRPIDDFSLVTVSGSVVSVFTAKSQDYASMDKKKFRESAEKVLEIIAAEIGVAKQELSDNAGRAA